MDDNLVNADLILEWIEKQVANRHVIDPGTWMDACLKLNILRADEDDKLAELQQQVAMKKVGLLQEDKNVSRAKLIVEASDEFKSYLKQKAKIVRIEEAIRLSKIQAKLKAEEYRNGK